MCQMLLVHANKNIIEIMCICYRWDIGHMYAFIGDTVKTPSKADMLGISSDCPP